MAAWQLLNKVPAPLQVKAAEHAATFNIAPGCASFARASRPNNSQTSQWNPCTERARQQSQRYDSERNQDQCREFN